MLDDEEKFKESDENIADFYLENADQLYAKVAITDEIGLRNLIFSDGIIRNKGPRTNRSLSHLVIKKDGWYFKSDSSKEDEFGIDFKDIEFDQDTLKMLNSKSKTINFNPEINKAAKMLSRNLTVPVIKFNLVFDKRMRNTPELAAKYMALEIENPLMLIKLKYGQAIA